MSRVTLKNINDAIHNTGLVLHRSEGYFYFSGEGVENVEEWYRNVYVPTLNVLKLIKWVEAANECAAKIAEYNAKWAD